ncbi:unnamed protein product [Paramecium primaurelia]|uniref:Uncharacterized protein n=1 Tax=Paramecium primaurelia TaxID=5886 RepID=A0A8S1L7T4_PARPR|nr:unnamed protein product [Paramecium primaurelia]
MQSQSQVPLQIEHYIIGKTLGVGRAIKIINKKKMKNSRMEPKIRREI